MFIAEAAGLEALATANEIRTPRVLACGATSVIAYIVIEWIDFDNGGVAAERRLGERLAALHRHTSDRFGWHIDNTIGSTLQHNDRSADWVGFFREHRLCYQLELAGSKGYGGVLQTKGHRLAENLPHLFTDYQPRPSLLHGDLWGGNWGSCNDEPVVFDPAVYYGDRETDIAMTRLFGGFGQEFYDAYSASWPMEDGYESRQLLYQLYHVLNHLNLFGSGYLGRAMDLLDALNKRTQTY
jgi:fructosamine-3-kinase